MEYIFYSVLDIDDCLNNDCDYGTCQDEVNGYSCLCNDGYYGDLCEITVCRVVNCENGGTCVVNEVTQGQGQGQDDEEEQELDLGFRCECAPDFEGKFCKDSKLINCDTGLQAYP